MKAKYIMKTTAILLAVMVALTMSPILPTNTETAYAATSDRSVSKSEYMDISALPEDEQIVDGGQYVFSANITPDINLSEDYRGERLLTTFSNEYNSVYITYDDVTVATDRELSQYDNNVVWNNKNKYVYQIAKVNGNTDEGNQGYYIRIVEPYPWALDSIYLDLKQDLQTPVATGDVFNDDDLYFCYKDTHGYSPAYRANLITTPTYPYVYLSETPRVWYWDSENKEFYTRYTMPGYEEDHFGFANAFSVYARAFVWNDEYEDPDIMYSQEILCNEYARDDNGRWQLLVMLMDDRYIYTTDENLGIYALDKWASGHFGTAYFSLSNGENCKFVLQGMSASKSKDYHKRPAVEELRDPAYHLGIKRGLSYGENNFSTAMLGAYHPGMYETFGTWANQPKARAERKSLTVYKKISSPRLTFDYNDGTDGSRYERFYYNQEVPLSGYKPYNTNDATFLGWSTSKHGDVINNITLTSDQTLYAQWKELNVAVEPNDEQLGQVTFSEPTDFNGKMYKGETLEATATPKNENVIFNGWKVGDEIVSTEPTYRVDHVTTDLTVTAMFECPGHHWAIKKQPATDDADGRVYKKCTVCESEVTLGVNPSAGEDDIVLGTGVLKDTANQPNAQTVHMADNAWRVIGYDGVGVASGTDTMTLISSGNIKDKIRFSDGGNAYSGSTLQSEVNAVASGFTEGEQAAIAPRNLAAGDYSEPVDGQPQTDGIAGQAVDGALLWPLSAKEAGETNEVLRIADPTFTDPTWPGYWPEPDTANQSWPGFWWLRSRGELSFAAAADHTGVVYEGYPVGRVLGLRPAFDLDLGAVLFTSGAEGGKISGDVGADALTQPGKNRSCEWKLTVKDNAHKDFAVDSVMTSDGELLTVKYHGAVAGEDEYISAIITSADGKVKSYGKLALASDQDGATCTVNIKGKMEEGDKLCIFNEQCNGDNKTDYASELQEATIITKEENPLKIKPKTAKVKYSKLKKKSQKLKVSKVINFIKKGEGTMSYVQKSNKKKFKINKKTGQVTVKKGLKKGTYKVKVKVRAAGNDNYNASTWKQVTFKVKVK